MLFGGSEVHLKKANFDAFFEKIITKYKQK